jgi:ABC-type multidrug transport system fused ATPase/permease subunit
VQLFDRSVADNIALGTRATAAEIEAAARQSLAHDFITRLPAGYATRIGADGVQLSGGERQKLALARALVRDPAILVLDEATAMFDAAAEQALVEQWLATRERNDGRIIIVITHRAPLLALADRIIRMTSDGRIEEEADHGARAAVVRPCTPSLRMARANRAGA